MPLFLPSHETQMELSAHPWNWHYAKSVYAHMHRRKGTQQTFTRHRSTKASNHSQSEFVRNNVTLLEKPFVNSLFHLAFRQMKRSFVGHKVCLIILLTRIVNEKCSYKICLYRYGKS